MGYVGGVPWGMWCGWGPMGYVVWVGSHGVCGVSGVPWGVWAGSHGVCGWGPMGRTSEEVHGGVDASWLLGIGLAESRRQRAHCVEGLGVGREEAEGVKVRARDGRCGGEGAIHRPPGERRARQQTADSEMGNAKV
jgi:hypothetical protein